jgi:SAM-dependent methyltransferase
MKNIIDNIRYYFWASFQRKLLDSFQEKYRFIYRGVVLDIGGRDRGKFKKPKQSVEKWIFADICADHKPDIVLDMADMSAIESGTVDVIVAMEVFAHVERLDQGLDECFRILKDDGSLIFSAPLLHPIINDPCDYRRYTASGWEMELKKRHFYIKDIETLGRYFTVMADFIIMVTRSMPSIFRYIGYILYPLLSLAAWLDTTGFVLKNKKLSSFTTGYFIVARKTEK